MMNYDIPFQKFIDDIAGDHMDNPGTIEDECRAETNAWFDECNPAIYTEFELEQMALLEAMKQKYGRVPAEL